MKTLLISQGSLLALLLASVGGGGACSSTATSHDGSGGSTGKGGTTGPGGATGPNTGLGGTTGPTTGLGGTTGPNTGAGGGSTTTVVQKLCAAKTTLGNPVLLNFESYDGTVTADKFGAAFGGATPGTGTAYTGPYAFGDGSVTPTLALLAGHPPSQWAVSETAHALTWGMGGGFWMSCANASAFKGISFWVRGSSPTGVFSFNVSTESTVMPDAANAAGGGTCPGTTATCIAPTKLNIPLTADWTQVQLMWADFAPGLSGSTPVTLNGDNITGLGWSVPLMFTLDPSAGGDAAGPYVGVAGDLVINIDDVSFIP